MARFRLFFLFVFAISLFGCKGKNPNATAAEKPKIVFSMGDFERVKGTDFMMAAVRSTDVSKNGGILSKIGSESSYDDSDSVTHNFIFLNLKDNSFTQLFPNNDYLISRLNTFPNKSEGGNEPKVEFFIYRIVKADTNNDQKLNDEDKRVLAISDVSGSGYTELIDGIGSIYAEEMKDANTLTIVYWKDSKRWISNIDVRNKKLTFTGELPEFTKSLN